MQFRIIDIYKFIYNKLVADNQASKFRTNYNYQCSSETRVRFDLNGI